MISREKILTFRNRTAHYENNHWVKRHRRNKILKINKNKDKNYQITAKQRMYHNIGNKKIFKLIT